MIYEGKARYEEMGPHKQFIEQVDIDINRKNLRVGIRPPSVYIYIRYKIKTKKVQTDNINGLNKNGQLIT